MLRFYFSLFLERWPRNLPELTDLLFFRFDTSDNGRRLASVVEDGKLKIKTISDSPEIRNLSDQDDEMLHNNNAHNSGDESDDGSADGTDAHLDNQTETSASSC